MGSPHVGSYSCSQHGNDEWLLRSCCKRIPTLSKSTHFSFCLIPDPYNIMTAKQEPKLETPASS